MGDAFQLTMPAWAVVVRTSLVYLALVTRVRVIPKRGVGNLSPDEMLALVLMGTMAADGIMGGTHSVANALLMIAVIVGCSYLFDLPEYCFPSVYRLLRDGHTPPARNGGLPRRNMRREMITEEELRAALRQEGGRPGDRPVGLFGGGRADQRGQGERTTGADTRSVP
jgi:uncharacterized membrane protein YcaP (DUF421 family)